MGVTFWIKSIDTQIFLFYNRVNLDKLFSFDLGRSWGTGFPSLAHPLKFRVGGLVPSRP